jgi:chemotaxis protein MotB
MGCVLLGLSAAGCGFTSEEWQAQVDKNARLDAALHSTEAKLTESQSQGDHARKRLDELTRMLDAAQLDPAHLREMVRQGISPEERDRAVAELRQRAQKLEQAKARFDALRLKLAEAAIPGALVGIRHDRVTIALPGDTVFEKGGEHLSKEGKEALSKVAAVLKSDPALATRDYEVVAHLDSKAGKKGSWREALDLSLARAREALLDLLEKEGLPTVRWSATGRGDVDPIASNDAEEGRAKNRRLEIVMLPSSDELLDLKPLAQ